MKRIFLSIIPVLLSISGFCQGLKPVKLDSDVTVSLFPGYQKKDTTNESVYSVNGMYGYMIAIRETNAKNNAPLKKARDLNRELKTYIKGIQAEVENSSAQNVRDTTIGTLKAKLFTLKSDGDETEAEYRNFMLLYTRDITYTFEYVYPATRADIIKDENKQFFSSIRISPGLTWNEQYLSKATGMSSITEIELFGGLGIALVLVIVLVVRKRSPAIS